MDLSNPTDTVRLMLVNSTLLEALKTAADDLEWAAGFTGLQDYRVRNLRIAAQSARRAVQVAEGRS